jgi:hypothetical protein
MRFDCEKIRDIITSNRKNICFTHPINHRRSERIDIWIWKLSILEDRRGCDGSYCEWCGSVRRHILEDLHPASSIALITIDLEWCWRSDPANPWPSVIESSEQLKTRCGRIAMTTPNPYYKRRNKIQVASMRLLFTQEKIKQYSPKLTPNCEWIRTMKTIIGGMYLSYTWSHRIPLYMSS